ncbi:MAG: type II toxin-antitoxin system HicB family antitoxin [Leptolyngbyaceae cyanobacterium SM1_4_3]|nr:type II toxin-antitoxin system HicB family antitoxin [Leptolyngbyaceae cyanobacterium SM1_4_3]
MKETTYTVIIHLEETGWWLASVKELEGCHTQAANLRSVRERIREAMSLFVEDTASVRLKEVFV